MSSGDTDMNDVPVLLCDSGEVTEWIAIQRSVSKPWNFRLGGFISMTGLGAPNWRLSCRLWLRLDKVAASAAVPFPFCREANN